MEIKARITYEPVSDVDPAPWTARVYVGGTLSAILFENSNFGAAERAKAWAEAHRNAQDAGDGGWITL